MALPMPTGKQAALAPAALCAVLLGPGHATLALAAAPCPTAELIEPAEAIIADPRPLLRWAPLPGVERYRLRLRSRVPEGEQLEALDTLVEDTSLRVPRGLTEHRALVTVTITAVCPGAPDSPSSGRFLIDTGLTCEAPVFVWNEAGQHWTWNAVPGAQHYELLRYAPDSARLIDRGTSAMPRVVEAGSALLAVRARCAHGYSALRFAP